MITINAKSISYGGKRSLSSVRYIVIHYTGNRGDTAKNNGDYFAHGNTREAGAHFFVDRMGYIVKSIPLERIAWAVGGDMRTGRKGEARYFGKCKNANSVSIELCDVSDKYPSSAQLKAVRDTIAYIRKHCPYASTIIRHFDVNGKLCPKRMAGEKNAEWIRFLKDINASPKTGNTAPPYPTVTLRRGSKGDQVKRLQRCLNKIMDSGLAVDGSFGPATDRAVRAYQKKRHLAVDGSVGPQTRAAIRKDIGK